MLNVSLFCFFVHITLSINRYIVCEENSTAKRNESYFLSDPPVKHKSRRSLKLPKGSGFLFKNSINFQIQSKTNLEANLQLAHSIPFSFKNLYPEIKIFNEGLNINKVNKFKHILKKSGFKIPDIKITMINNNLAQKNKENLFREALKQNVKRGQLERTIIYKDLEAFIEKMGLPSKPCFLRTICEVAVDPFEENMFGEIFNIIFTPSMSANSETEGGESEVYDSYIQAEQHGKKWGICNDKFSECPESVFTLIQNLLQNLFVV